MKHHPLCLHEDAVRPQNLYVCC